MSAVLSEVILTDHHQILSLARDLRDECKLTEFPTEKCLAAFRHWKIFLTAHIKAEEYMVYALFEEGTLWSQAELKRFIYEGYEEHDVIDRLLKEMGQAEEITPSWLAKLKVLLHVLDHHLRNEEERLLPRLSTALSVPEQTKIAQTYQRERDQIFSKKIGATKVTPKAIHDLSFLSP